MEPPRGAPVVSPPCYNFLIVDSSPVFYTPSLQIQWPRPHTSTYNKKKKRGEREIQWNVYTFWEKDEEYNIWGATEKGSRSANKCPGIMCVHISSPFKHLSIIFSKARNTQTPWSPWFCCWIPFQSHNRSPQRDINPFVWVVSFWLCCRATITWMGTVECAQETGVGTDFAQIAHENLLWGLHIYKAYSQLFWMGVADFSG